MYSQQMVFFEIFWNLDLLNLYVVERRVQRRDKQGFIEVTIGP